MANNKIRILVTPCKDPDLDGTACAYAYAEFLRKTSMDEVIGAISGSIHREAQFVFKTFNISPMDDAEKEIKNCNKIIIVDASDLRSLSDKIDPKKVMRVIDHRIVNDSHLFPNAKLQIEPVGSAATLIAEKFFNAQIQISRESAALLFSAIISNTINFQARVTTSRDRKMASWLKSKSILPADYIHNMFTSKSNIGGSLEEVFYSDFATFSFNKTKLGIAQLEIIRVDSFVDKNLEQIIETLEKIKKEKGLNLILLSAIDLEKGFNKFVAIDKETEKVLLSSVHKTKFIRGIAKRDGIIMRKELAPLIKNVLESTK